MRIFTLIVYILIGLLIAGFATMNFERVPMWIAPGYEANWPFAVYIIVALILGALPVSIMHSISRWRWKRRVKKLEAQLMAPERADAYHERAPEDPVPPLSGL